MERQATVLQTAIPFYSLCYCGKIADSSLSSRSSIKLIFNVLPPFPIEGGSHVQHPTCSSSLSIKLQHLAKTQVLIQSFKIEFALLANS